MTICIAIYKLKVQNVLFWLIAPTVATKYYYDCHIHERIDNMWRVHMNRVDKGNNPQSLTLIIGLDGTYKQHGVYDDKMQEYNYKISNGVHMRMDSIVHGIVEQPYLDNPFQRFHESIE